SSSAVTGPSGSGSAGADGVGDGVGVGEADGDSAWVGDCVRLCDVGSPGVGAVSCSGPQPASANVATSSAVIHRASAARLVIPVTVPLVSRALVISRVAVARPGPLLRTSPGLCTLAGRRRA